MQGGEKKNEPTTSRNNHLRLRGRVTEYFDRNRTEPKDHRGYGRAGGKEQRDKTGKNIVPPIDELK